MKRVGSNDTWMDGLPRCPLSGVGISPNQMYREDGTPYSEHEYEDRSIHFCIDNEKSTYLYGVFDGHDGIKASNFASQRMPAELSFEQLEGKTSEEEVKEIFHQAFLSVENAFLESIDPKIAERTQLLEKIPENMTQFEAAQHYPDTFSRLQDLEEEIRSGTTAVVALVHRGVLYIGNVGDSRALLCQKDKSGVLRMKQLSTDHTTSSYDELERLSSLSLDNNKIKGAKFGNNEITRCVGSYFLKGGYKEFDMLASATGEPVICEPSITSVPIDESCSFLLLMSDGLYKSYVEATGSEHSNKDIATMVVEQFMEQSTLTSVAQTVVDKVVRLHHDAFLTQKGNVSMRDDITLVIRNFNFQFPSSFQPQAFLAPSQHLQNKNTAAATASSSENEDEDLTLCDNYLQESGLAHPEDGKGFPYLDGPPTTFSSNDGEDRPSSNSEAPPLIFSSNEVEDDPAHFDAPPLSYSSTDRDGLPYIEGPPFTFSSTEDRESTPSSIFHTSATSSGSSKLSNPSLTQLTLDDEGRIKSYVNFDEYFRKVDEAIANGTIPKSQISYYKW